MKHPFIAQCRPFAVAFLIALGATVAVSAQNISGVINEYAKVLTIDDCAESFKVRSNLNQTNVVQHFAADKKILIIQMQGAIVSLDDDPTFGTVKDYMQAGYFEFALINAVTYLGSQSIGGTTWYDYEVTVNAPLKHWYDPSQSVQIVSVPIYTNPTVTGTLTAEAWNPDMQMGGVLALEALTLTLNADIDVSGQGFKGGAVSAAGSTTGEAGFVYSEASGTLQKSAYRGEGLARIDQGIESSQLLGYRKGGRGNAANAGGGGNARSAGGGGGSNAGKGGRGGNQLITSGRAEIGGIGGSAFKYSSAGQVPRAMMGGGGGGGHFYTAGNPGTGKGGSGGGIIFIITNDIIGNEYSIKANGSPGGTAANNGAGGGGGGGSILLYVNDTDDEPLADPDLYIEAKGGNGGHATGTVVDCYGPGGGGGGGLIWLKGSSKPSFYKVNDVDPNTGAPGLLGGTAGAPTNCTVDLTNGAKSGTKGVLLFNLVLP